MMKLLAGGFGLQVFLLASAHAACPTFPYSFANGSTADANQVNANFNNVVTCFAPLANPSFTGNVGIGTSTPAGSLMIQGNVGGWSSFNFGKQLLVTAPGGNNPSIGITDSSGNNPWAISNASGLVFAEMPAFSNNTSPPLQRVIIKAGGNVGIGTIAPSYTLQVNGTAAGSQAWIVASDRRLKMNIEPISNALDLVARLRPVRFQWRPSSERDVGGDLNLPQDTKQIGFIAQEVEQVIPEAVVPPKAGSKALYGLKVGDLVPILVEAIKEQQAEIGELRASLAALKLSRSASR